MNTALERCDDYDEAVSTWEAAIEELGGEERAYQLVVRDPRIDRLIESATT